MKFWIDAQLPRRMVKWLPERYGVEASLLLMLGLREDHAIFEALRQPGQVIVSKDEDFPDLVLRLGAPPQVLWITCGNVTNRSLHALFDRGFPRVLELFRAGEPIVQLHDK